MGDALFCNDISGGLERIPVSFINEVDEEELPYFEVGVGCSYYSQSCWSELVSASINSKYRGW